jgi:subtilisin-like proprotein convertase family protein
MLVGIAAAGRDKPTTARGNKGVRSLLISKTAQSFPAPTAASAAKKPKPLRRPRPGGTKRQRPGRRSRNFSEVEIAISENLALDDISALPRAPGSKLQVMKNSKNVRVQLPTGRVETLAGNGADIKTLRQFALIEASDNNEEAISLDTSRMALSHCAGSNNNYYPIPDANYPNLWAASTIPISCASSGDTITSIDVYYEIIHPWIGDLYVKLTDQDQTAEHLLWDFQGGGSEDIWETVTGISTFNGESVNQTWYLRAADNAYDDAGYIKYWWIKVYYGPDDPEDDPNVCDIEGYKFDDADGNGLWDQGEAGLADWMIFLDTNTNGQYDPGEPNTITDLQGHYEFLEIDPGTYTVAEVMQDGWTQTMPGENETYQIIAEPNQVYPDNNFGNTTQPLTVTLSGHVTMDDGTAIESWQLDLDLDGNIFTPEMSTTTDPLGYYQFDLEAPWTGTLLLQLPDRWYSHWATLRQNITTDITDNFVCHYQYDAGNGTAGDPYQIRTAEQLNMIGHMPSQWDNYFVLTSDINLDAATYSTAIIPSFSGQFDGAGFSVLNLQSHSGLFGDIKNAVIKNLGVENVEITGAGIAGALCNSNHGGTIENCFTTGNISGFYDVGGLCALVHAEYLGHPPFGQPLPPVNTPVIKNCYSTVNVTLNHPHSLPEFSTGSAGGLCAYAEGAELLNNYACGSVDATGTNTPFDFDIVIDNGGLVGNIKNCNVYNNYSSGYVVDGRAYSNPGGFCGAISDDQTIFAGNFWNNSVNPSLQGIGNAADTYGVIGESTANMQTETTFTDAGWDFTTPAWTIWEAMGYPRLAWENALSGDFALDHQWMYQNRPGQTASNLTATVSITDDPAGNNSYTYQWQIVLPSDVNIEPVTLSGGNDQSWTFAAPGCDEPTGISELGETFQVMVTITGNDYRNTGSAQLQFGIALLGDVNNDSLVDIADRGITNAFWRTGSAGPFTLRDCDVNCDGMIDVADRGITNAIWRGSLGSNSVASPCPLR